MSDKLIDINPQGVGPFVLPLLAKLESIDVPKTGDFVVAQFRFEDGAPIHVPISNLALEGLYDSIAALYHSHGGKLPGTDPQTH